METIRKAVLRAVKAATKISGKWLAWRLYKRYNSAIAIATKTAMTYALTPDEVQAAIAGHNLRTYSGWIDACRALLAGAPAMTAISEKGSKCMALKAPWGSDSTNEVFAYYDANGSGVYDEEQLSDFDSSAWNGESWDGVSVESNIATLTNPVFVTLRHE